MSKHHDQSNELSLGVVFGVCVVKILNLICRYIDTFILRYLLVQS